MRIAFDLDGTLVDMASALAAEADKLFDPRSRPDDQDESDGEPDEGIIDIPSSGLSRLALTDHQRARLWHHVEKVPNFWMTLKETEKGVVKRLAKVATERRWEVIFLTTRPTVAGKTTQVQSQEWLDAHGFHFPSVYVVQRSRGRIADALGLHAVVDDRPENCIDVATESKAHAILIHPASDHSPLPGAGRLGVRVVKSASDAIALLQKLQDTKVRTGVTRRLRKLFGQ